MLYKFPGIKEQNDLTEEKLELLKKEYGKLEMTKEQLDKLKQKMEEAKMVNKKECCKMKI